MNERKSKETKALIRNIKKITIAIFILCLITIHYAKSYMVTEGTKFIDQWYDKHGDQPMPPMMEENSLFRVVPE